MLILNDYGELNQSQLMSYSGLNNVKHKPIIDELVEKGLIIRFEEPWGEQNKIIKYRVSEKGRVSMQYLSLTNCCFQGVQRRRRKRRRSEHSAIYWLVL